MCGYSLISHPSPAVSWTDPQHKQVANSSRYLVDDGPGVVQLNITEASKGDNGTWKCTVSVYHSFKLMSDGALSSDTYSNESRIEVRLFVVGEYNYYIRKAIFIDASCIRSSTKQAK